MKKILFFLLFLGVISVHSEAFSLTLKEREDCQKLIQIAENKQIDYVYNACGFDDKMIAWYEWAPFASAKNYKKALYELCRRHPEHEYSSLYCQKSADLDYAPAYYLLANEAKSKGQINLYETYLKKVIALNNIKNKNILTTEADFAARQAYEDLAKFYYEQSKNASKEVIVNNLKIAADAGSLTAAHSLGVLSIMLEDPTIQSDSFVYLWKAILGGCSAAEENLGLINALMQQRLYKEDALSEIQKRMFTCKPSALTERKLFLSAKDCDCPAVLSWYEAQKDKPFLVKEILKDTAVLLDENGEEYTVAKGDKVTDGFVVEDVRPTAVIVRKLTNRYILLFREDEICVDLCQNPNVIPKRFVKDLPPYNLVYTPEECLNLARSIEHLNNPMKPFRGLPECQLQDWKKWGEQALAEKRNKHLFLLANYEQSSYIPSKVVELEAFLKLGGEESFEQVNNLMNFISKEKTSDELSEMKKQEAFCLLAKSYLNTSFNDYSELFKWTKIGADEGYPFSVNLLGVLYAVGLGTEVDTQKAMELFKLADEFSQTPYLPALENYYLLKNNGDLKNLHIPACNNIMQASPLSIEDLLKFY